MSWEDRKDIKGSRLKPSSIWPFIRCSLSDLPIRFLFRMRVGCFRYLISTDSEFYVVVESICYVDECRRSDSLCQDLISVTYLPCLDIVQDVCSCRWVADVLWDDHNYTDEESWYLLINATWSPEAIGRQLEMPPHKCMKLNLDLFVLMSRRQKHIKFVCKIIYHITPWLYHGTGTVNTDSSRQTKVFAESDMNPLESCI